MFRHADEDAHYSVNISKKNNNNKLTKLYAKTSDFIKKTKDKSLGNEVKNVDGSRWWGERWRRSMVFSIRDVVRLQLLMHNSFFYAGSPNKWVNHATDEPAPPTWFDRNTLPNHIKNASFHFYWTETFHLWSNRKSLLDDHHALGRC